MTTLIHTFGGNVGVGTNDPGSYSLSVLGSTKADSLVVNGVTDAEVKIGLISMWMGSIANIPSGWVLCNGQTVAKTNGSGNITTPNLTTRFIIGADGDDPSPAVPGQTGGINVHGITEGELPIHSHVVTVEDSDAPHSHTLADAQMPHAHNTGNANANHSHGIGNSNAPHRHPYAHAGIDNGVADNFFWGGNYRAGKQLTNFNTNHGNAAHAHNSGQGGSHNHSITSANSPHTHPAGDGNAPHTHTSSVSSSGGSDQISVTNPFYVLAFIMKH